MNGRSAGTWKFAKSNKRFQAANVLIKMIPSVRLWESPIMEFCTASATRTTNRMSAIPIEPTFLRSTNRKRRKSAQ